MSAMLYLLLFFGLVLFIATTFTTVLTAVISRLIGDKIEVTIAKPLLMKGAKFGFVLGLLCLFPAISQVQQSVFDAWAKFFMVSFGVLYFFLFIYCFAKALTKVLQDKTALIERKNQLNARNQRAAEQALIAQQEVKSKVVSIKAKISELEENLNTRLVPPATEQDWKTELQKLKNDLATLEA